jgi:hypothetical protein
MIAFSSKTTPCSLLFSHYDTAGQPSQSASLTQLVYPNKTTSLDCFRSRKTSIIIESILSGLPLQDSNSNPFGGLQGLTALHFFLGGQDCNLFLPFSYHMWSTEPKNTALRVDCKSQLIYPNKTTQYITHLPPRNTLIRSKFIPSRRTGLSCAQQHLSHTTIFKQHHYEHAP